MMKIKNTIKLVALLGVVVTAVNMFTAAPASALKCASGTVLHADNLCWKESSPYRGTSCSNGTGSYSSVNKKCNAYAGTPTNDNGSAINYQNLQCPSGTEAHPDGKCWRPSYKQDPNINEATCKKNGWSYHAGSNGGTGYCLAKEYEKVNKSQANCNEVGEHWDNGTCWREQYEGSEEPTGYKGTDVNDRNTKEGCEAHGGTWTTNRGTGTAGACAESEAGCANVKGTWNPQTNQCENVPGVDDAAGSGTTANTSPYTADTETCGKARTNIIACDGEGVEALGDVLKIILFILTTIVGIVAVGGIAYAATLYASAEDNAGQISKAKSIIRDVVIGIVLYALLVALVNWLVPTAVFGS